MSIEDLFTRVRAGHGDATAIERTRLERDLARIVERVERGQYRVSAFGTNTFDVLDRRDEFFRELEFHAGVGRAWARVMDEVGGRDVARVIDFCPGHAPKIELALFYLGYQGEVFVIDKDRTALAHLDRFISLFQPRFRLVPVQLDALDAMLPMAPLVVANHVLDDFVLDRCAARAGLAPHDVYAQERMLVDLWRSIAADGQRVLEEMTPLIAGALASAVEPGGTLIVTQYPGYLERILDLNEASRLCAELLGAVMAELASRGFAEDAEAPKRALAGPGLLFDASQCRVVVRARAEE